MSSAPESPRTIRFDDRVVLVTGAGRGLGRAYALLLAERGARVVVHDAGVAPDGTGEDRTVARGVVDEIRALGGSATSAYQNLESRDACHELVRDVLHGHGRIDAVVLNAGIVLREGLEDLIPETWDRIRRVQVESPLWISQAAFAAMRERGYGRFVLTVSGHGLTRTGQPELAAYAVAKAATFGLLNVLADAGEPVGIRANAISPVAATRMYTRSVEPGTMLPEHVAPGVVYLASEACAVSGAVLQAADGRFSLAGYRVSGRVDLGRAPVSPEAVAAAWTLMDRSGAPPE